MQRAKETYRNDKSNSLIASYDRTNVAYRCHTEVGKSKESEGNTNHRWLATAIKVTISFILYY